MPTTIPIWEGELFTLATLELFNSLNLSEASLGWKISGPGFNTHEISNYEL